MINTLQLSLACVRYDRTRAILSGDLRPEGVELSVREIVDHDSNWLLPMRYRIFDVAEMPITNYLIGLDQGHADLVAIPVFLSRSFRHSTLYINRDSGISTPKDLEGKRVGIGNYFGSTTLWARGLLAEQYKVHLDAIIWVTKNTVDRTKLPSSVRLEQVGQGKDFSEMLESGEIDALISERPPRCFNPSLHVARLFPRYKTEEIEFYRNTNIFPIRHVLVIKRSIYEANPWVAQSLYKMFDLAKNATGIRHMFDGHSKLMLPSLQYAIAETRKVFGDDCWPYGIERNKNTLEALTRYCHEQGYTSRRFGVQEIFVSNIASPL